ncbi:MAG TPA: nucleotide exchange factor GrpE [Xanthomonadaceae bacterium]|nr:nucleotide exchange factor GrpE [Xanthomonadaceae bacterium]
MQHEPSRKDEGPDTPEGQPQAQNGFEPGSTDAEAAGEFDDMAQRLAEAEAALAQLGEQMLRERADLDNQRKRMQRDLENSRRFANEKILADLLPVIDSLERGLNAGGTSADAEALREGTELTVRQLLKTLADHGVTVIDPQGERFNPEKHQALSMAPATGVQDEHVLTVVQKGFQLHDRLLRPALVVVARNSD